MAAPHWTRVLRVDPRHMMTVLLLLCACVSVGLSYEDWIKKAYGNQYSFWLNRKAHSIEFRPVDSSSVTILWKRDDPQPTEDLRHKLVYNHYELHNLTQEDNGRYIVKDKNQRVLYTKIVQIEEYVDHSTKMTGESISFTYALKPDSCNIYFYPGGDYETVIVLHGRLQHKDYSSDCPGFELLKPCGILKDNAEMSCSGRFEMRDNNNNKAYVNYLQMELRLDEDEDDEDEHYDSPYLGAGVAAVITFVLSCCIKCCCLRKSSSQKRTSESDATPAAAEPAVYLHEYDHEPAGRRINQLSEPSGTHHPTQASCASTGPLIHNPPDSEPPAYSEVFPPAEQAAAPPLPPYSEVDPHFDVRGISFNSALSSDSTSCDVYTSDKLNFL